MSDIIKSKLEQLADDDLMLKAIESIFGEQIDKNKPDIEKTDNDNLLGEKYRAYEKAKKILSDAMTAIKNYKVIKDNKPNFKKER